MHEHQRKDRHQHQQAAGLGVDEEAGGGTNPGLPRGAAVPPEGNQKIHGYQHHFPEQEEQEQVQRQKHTHDATQNKQQIQMKKAHPLDNLFP